MQARRVVKQIPVQNVNEALPANQLDKGIHISLLPIRCQTCEGKALCGV